MPREAIVRFDPTDKDSSLTVHFVDEHGEEWIHGFHGFEDGNTDPWREIREWLTPKPGAAPFADLRESPTRDRALEHWRKSQK